VSVESGIYKLKDSILTIIEPVFLISPCENLAQSQALWVEEYYLSTQMMVVPRKLSSFVLY